MDRNQVAFFVLCTLLALYVYYRTINQVPVDAYLEVISPDAWSSARRIKLELKNRFGLRIQANTLHITLRRLEEEGYLDTMPGYDEGGQILLFKRRANKKPSQNPETRDLPDKRVEYLLL